MMEVGDELASGLCIPRLEDEGKLQLGGHGIHNSVPRLKVRDVDPCPTVGDMDDLHLLGASDSVPGEGVEGGAAVADVPSPEIDLKVDLEAKMSVEDLSLVKRRRGRPPRGQPKPTPLPRKSLTKDEEDVCFICFDGGSLVLCDRRGCPKAYHPACIKRDDAFFQSKAKWNCGWHICSNCRKASHYMCYTCTFSLCKGCIKDADYQCVRGNKGLCGTCMKTIMLLEKSLLGNSVVVAQVDFDDKSSWEYLFKIYWVCLKQKLSLTIDELAHAKNPWKGGGTVDQNGGGLSNCCDANDSKSGGSDSASKGMEVANSRRKAFKRQQNFSYKVGFLTENSTDDRMMTSTQGKVWATNELLEFVAHMRNGDMSVLSHFDVEFLVLEYIKEKNLRDPQQRSQIICDRMLMNLFGKERIGHFEMLKLLEYHLLTKESSSSADRNSKVLDNPVGQVEVKGSFSCHSITDIDRKHRKRRKADDSKQQTNRYEYAAVSVHNINLIYLPRNLIETILGDTENFHDKIVGSIVRIQISRCDQKPDLYRLVQVVGTCNSSEPYAIGEKTTDVMLDILNLDKKEAISLEGISNQEFSEDECRRLRESVKCGLLKRFTVGEIQKKAMALQALKVNDRLESEMLQLNHLHERAREKGYGKELKELAEKLQLLRSTKERQHRLAEIPEVHVDPTMDPSYESDNHTKELKKTKQGGFMKTCKIGSGRMVDDLIYHCGGHDMLFDSSSRIQNHSANKSEQNTNICTAEGACRPTDTMLESSWYGSQSPSAPKNHENPASSIINNGSNQAVVSEVLLPLSKRIDHFMSDTDMEKMWRYQDPAGNVQGPFSMVQLQKWSSSGHFPLHLRVWKISEMPSDSILLTDALMAQDGKKSLQRYKNEVLSAIGLCSDDGEDQSNDEWSRNLHTNESGSPPDWNRPADVVNSSECQPKRFEQRTANEDSTGTNQSQVRELTPTLSAQPLQFSNQIGEAYRGEKSTSPALGNQSSHKTIEVEANSGQSCEKRSDSECCSGQSSGQNWRPLPGNATQDSTDGVISSAKSTEQQNCDLDFPDLPCPTPKGADVGITGQAAEIKQSVSSGILIQDSVPSWSAGSSLVGGRRQLPDVAGWGVYSPAPTKASTEERDSSLITASSLKPAEFISDCAATPASVNDQFTHPSPSHPQSNVSDWPEIIEPNEFNSLGDESLSDLLAEVEAMESLSELASSTSIMNCRDDLHHGCKTDCFGPIGRLSPNPEMGKGDALSSTGDGHGQSQSTITDEPLLRLHVFDIDPQMKLAGRSAMSADVDINKKYNDVSTNQWKGGTLLQNLTHFSAALNMDTAENTWRIGSEGTWGSADIGWGGLNKGGNPSLGWEIRLDSIQEMGSMNSGTSAGNNTTSWFSQSNRLPSPRDRSNQGRDLDNGRGRCCWNKQQAGTGLGGGDRSGTTRPSPRGQGQRVCKFYESGYCKRGSSCSYLHL